MTARRAAPIGRGWGWRVRDALGRGTPRAAVLVYHRVGEDHDDPQRQVVRRSTLASHLRHLKRALRVVSAAEIVEMVRAREVEHGSVAVTFDDGYADNLHDAAPVAEEAGVPITVFVASGFVLSGRPFWWDLLWEASAGDIGGTPLAGLLEDGAHRAPGDRAARLERFRALQRRLVAMPAALRDEAIGPGRPGGSRPRPLTASELTDLASMPGVTLGAHTVEHPSLAQVRVERERWELEQARVELEAVCERTVDLVAYPFGKPGDAGPRTRDTAEACGYRGGFTTTRAPVTGSSDPLLIPRITMNECSESELARTLASVAGIGGRRHPRAGRRAEPDAA